jgi:hypothetical protein
MNYDELREKVSDQAGVLTIDMGVLRDAHKAGKLGVHVRANISKELRSRGMGHSELGTYQHEGVRIWLMGSPAGDLIESVNNVSPEADRAIRDAVESDSSSVLEKIRELVCT